MGAPESPASGSPFALDDGARYLAWRERKLRERPTAVDDLVVELRDPLCLSAAERDAIVDRCRRANLAVYAAPAHLQDKSVPQHLGRQLGLRRLDGNWLADEDGISSLTVSGAGGRRGYIPYTNRPIRWHTDGYYNPPQRTIRAMLLHCVRPAETGGENRVMDHEIAYLLLRDRDPELVRALAAPDAMTIPARALEGETDGEHGAAGIARADQSGPVFAIPGPTGDLHMRYTARTRSIAWRDDAATRTAVAALAALLESADAYTYRIRLDPGMGIVCNNVLHDRSGFVDSAHRRRLVYRARYLDRIAGTEDAWMPRASAR